MLIFVFLGTLEASHPLMDMRAKVTRIPLSKHCVTTDTPRGNAGKAVLANVAAELTVTQKVRSQLIALRIASVIVIVIQTASQGSVKVFAVRLVPGVERMMSTWKEARRALSVPLAVNTASPARARLRLAISVAGAPHCTTGGVRVPVLVQ